MITFKRVATVICEWDDGDRGCTETASFTRPPYWFNDEEFEKEAFTHFTKLGWDMSTIKHLCPYCASGRPSDED
jgi:hypothetical protein